MMKSTTRCLSVGMMAFAILTAQPAFAAKSCYTPAQLEAEQLLRLHSELMVITVTCRTDSQGVDLASAYGDFTRRNITVLHNAEQTMIDYYKSTSRGDPIEKLDRLRTILGNEFGQKSADMSAPAFCASYRDKVTQFDAALPKDIKGEVHRMEVAERSYVAPCAGSSTAVAGR